MAIEPSRHRRTPGPRAVAAGVLGILVLAGLSVFTAVQVVAGAPATPTSAAAGPAPAGPSIAVTSAAATPTLTTPAPAPTTTAAPKPAAPGRSVKKGVSTWDFSGVGAALKDVRATWYYNWAAGPTAGAGSTAEFVPMIWGPGSVTAGNLAKAKSAGTVLLGFNEPDHGEQSNLTPAQALDLWPQLQATGLRLGSPAVAARADQAGGWLDQFMTGARSRGYQINFITLHWYGSDFGPAAVGQLKSYLQNVYNRYHLPIWLTEYALIKFSSPTVYPTPDQQVAFIKGSTTMLDSLSYLERYAWFALPTSTGGDQTGLYRNGTTATAAGAAYRAV